MAFLGKGESGIFGRYWGADEESGFLHFNLCYYVPQQWAIEQGLEFFDPGVGSMHKTRRGFDSQMVYSAHRFSDPVMERIWKDNIPHINKQMQDQISQLNSHMPIKLVARESSKDSP
jgi:predicted N-acyltransferase